MITVAEMNSELVRLSHRLDEAQSSLVAAVQEDAEAQREYRKARANAYLATSGTVGEREASVDKTTADERYAAHLAEGLSKAALESVRNFRSQLSALQTMAGAVREEMKLARTGTEPAWTP